MKKKYTKDMMNGEIYEGQNEKASAKELRKVIKYM